MFANAKKEIRLDVSYPIPGCIIILNNVYLLPVMPDLIPAEDGIVDRHPVAAQSEKNLGFRVKPGMTK
jgi:hypothetical protein